MTDYYYKFADEAQAQGALADYYFDGWKTDGPGYSLDPCGAFVEVDDTDPENPISTLLEGWHLNLRVTDGRPAPAQEYLIEPEHPRRVWA
jgi:hypothetical protein